MESAQSSLEQDVPPGWKRRRNERSRIQYESPPPIVCIRSKSQLLRYQKDGKFKELDPNQVSFMNKEKRTSKNYVILQDEMSPGSASSSNSLTLPSQDVMVSEYSSMSQQSTAQDISLPTGQTVSDQSMDTFQAHPGLQSFCSQHTLAQSHPNTPNPIGANCGNGVNLEFSQNILDQNVRFQSKISSEQIFAARPEEEHDETASNLAASDYNEMVEHLEQETSTRMEDHVLLESSLNSSFPSTASKQATDDQQPEQSQLDSASGSYSVEINRSVNANKVKSKKTRQQKIDQEVAKIASAVTLLTIDASKPVDHKAELEAAASLLNKAREPKKLDNENLESLKLDLIECSDIESLVHKIRMNTETRNVCQQMEFSSVLEDFLQLSKSSLDSPLQTFPPNINQNLYHEIIKFGLHKSEDTVLFLLNFLVEKDKPVETDHVVKLAFLFSTIAHSVNRDNKALVKLKSLLMQSSGVTNEGLDAFLTLGMSESSRSLRNQKDFLAGIATQVVKAAAKRFPHQSTVDNLGKCF